MDKLSRRRQAGEDRQLTRERSSARVVLREEGRVGGRAATFRGGQFDEFPKRQQAIRQFPLLAIPGRGGEQRLHHGCQAVHLRTEVSMTPHMGQPRERSEASAVVGVRLDHGYRLEGCGHTVLRQNHGLNGEPSLGLIQDLRQCAQGFQVGGRRREPNLQCHADALCCLACLGQRLLQPIPDADGLIS
ncbi:hypothetical protein [Sphaerisporangium flaviroseum]|uniref:hypothetical protein n=1 Tax=Sphaerisporangium flaviroseum TaxID=509199 RepID=UPI0031ED046F